MNVISQTKVFNGCLQRIQHTSEANQCEMTFSIFMPPQADLAPVPVLYWLSGLTCSDENFCQKAGAFKYAAKYGLAIVCPDTSPRNIEIPDQDESYDFGSGAGFYLDATELPWSQHYNMYTYITRELPIFIESKFKVTSDKSISGHSMGGHGALVCGLKNPENYRSISAFSPIANPANCPWGEKAFTGYLGTDKNTWLEYDASHLVVKSNKHLPVLIDQGDMDEFLNEQLKPEVLVSAAEKSAYPLKFNMRAGYDHSYYFITSFIKSHIKHHAKALGLK